jgi:hypothetical protein
MDTLTTVAFVVVAIAVLGAGFYVMKPEKK